MTEHQLPPIYYQHFIADMDADAACGFAAPHMAVTLKPSLTTCPDCLAEFDGRVRIVNSGSALYKRGGQVIARTGRRVNVRLDGEGRNSTPAFDIDDVEPEQDDASRYETGPEPKLRDGEFGTCAHCNQPIEYLGEPYGAWWTHKSAPADGHDAELGGPA